MVWSWGGGGAPTASPLLQNQLTQDDIPLVRHDARIHDLGNIREIISTPFWPNGAGTGLHRPLMTLTLALEWWLGKGAVISYKVMSLTLLAAAALAVLILALELLPVGWAAAAALAFAVHPVHVEAGSVAINQGELLIGLGYALLVVWYLRLRRARLPSWRDRIVLALVMFVAILFRESGAVLPALLLATELLLLPGEPWRERLSHLRPTLLLQLLVVAIVLLIRSTVHDNVIGVFTAEALAGLGVGGRALTMLGVVPEYLRLLLWPASLQIDYSPGEIVAATSWGSQQSLGLAILLLVGLLALRLRRSAPVVVFGLAWVAIGIAPVHNVLVPTGIVLAERTLFLPSIGAVIAVAGLLASAGDRVAHARQQAWAWATGCLLAVVIALGASRSWSRYHVWHGDIRLWTQAVIDAPDSYRAWIALGSLMNRPEHQALGIKFAERGMQIFPQPAILFNLAQKYEASNRCDLAIPIFSQELRLMEFAPARSAYLSCLTWEGEYDRAYEEAMVGIRSGYFHNVFRAWRRYLEAVREERPRRHTRFAPPELDRLLAAENRGGSVWRIEDGQPTVQLP